MYSTWICALNYLLFLKEVVSLNGGVFEKLHRVILNFKNAHICQLLTAMNLK